MPDLTIADHGSICLLTPLTDAGKDWCSEHISPDHMTWGASIVVEPRYMLAIVDGALGDGLEVSG